jgi:hypothetical protein
MSLNLNQRVLEFLKVNPEQQFTARDIAAWVLSHYPKECEQKRKSSIRDLTTDDALQGVLATEIGAHRRTLPECVKTIEGPPLKYYYTEKSEGAEIEEAEHSLTQGPSGEAEPKESEFSLYPLLYQYLRSEDPVVFTKRINEKTSANSLGKNGNHWLHPDMVGIEVLGRDWYPEILSCVKEARDRRVRLWSFEVKVKVNRSNVRECFFQAVSNSSWANLGYLVARDFDEKIRKELRILSGAHGIGVIRINSDDPSQSQILIPAVERAEVNWDTASRLAMENKDFQDFLKQVRHFYQTGDIKETDWLEPKSEVKRQTG